MKNLTALLIFLIISSFAWGQKKASPAPPLSEFEETTEDDLNAIENREEEPPDKSIEYDNNSQQATQDEFEYNDSKESKNDQNSETDADFINQKTASDVKKRIDEKYSDKGPHVQVIPYFEGGQAPKLQKRLRTGEKIYKSKSSPQNYSGGLRMGPYFPGNLQGDKAGITYQNLYGKTSPMLFSFDFEYQFFKSLGKLGLQTSIGFFTASGQGRFVNRPAVQADEYISLYTFPVQGAALYHAQFWDKQPLIPFGGAGMAYFAMMESRDDLSSFSERFKFGGGAAWFWVAGAQLQLDWLDKEVVWQLDHEYGINHVYLTADARQYVGVGSTYDFSALYYEGGLLFEF